MIKGISYWSFPGGSEGTKPVVEAFVEAKKAGFESIELCLSDTGDVSLNITEAQAKTIVKAANDADIKISSVATGLFWGKSLTASDPQIRAEALKIAEKEIQTAAWLEAGAVLLIPGSVDVFFDPTSETVSYNDVWQRATDAVGSLVHLAESLKVAVGIENVWNKFLVGPAELISFIDQFNSDYIGSYFDVGNCMLTGYPEQWIRMLGKRIKRVHLKDFRRGVGTGDGFVDLLSGDVNWPEVISALKEINYDGYLTAEMIPIYKHYPEVLIDNTSRAMDAILGR
jgi:L-ribulose-5-phosphate 3-epimerase